MVHLLIIYNVILHVTTFLLNAITSILRKELKQKKSQSRMTSYTTTTTTTTTTTALDHHTLIYSLSDKHTLIRTITHPDPHYNTH